MATPATGGPVLAAVLDDDDDDAVTESQAPSHILQDGRFVILPDPTPAEHRRFVERSIARHGLLQHDLKQGRGSSSSSPRKSTAQAQLGGGEGEDETKEGDGDEDDGDEQKDAATQQQVHPLVLASARLTNDGINELNRAINLATLVQTNEYFGMSNIVADSALELASTEAAAAAAADKGEGSDKKKKTSASAATGSTGAGTAPSTNNNNTSASNSANNNNNNTNNNSSQRSIQATFVLKRKLAQFRQAASQLRTHQARLEAAIVAEHRPLARLRQLRPHWRWVAPEHGTRAAPHAARPTEVLCADVDLYHVVQHEEDGEQQQQQQQPLGRLARRVPRYATLQLKSEYQVELDAEQWRKKMKRTLPEESKSSSTAATTTAAADAKDEHSLSYSEAALWTRAEPFAIADPTLGKIDADFDPSKVVAMLTLEFAVEKAGVGTTARLEPFGQQEQHQPQQTSSTNAAAVDSQVLVALQHSLFCAKLFDAIRREVASDTEEVGQVRASTASQSERSTIWISSSSATSAGSGELFLPPPGSMVRHAIGPPVAVIHCHEGEVMVQLDCEYTLRIKLVEATTSDAAPATTTNHDKEDDKDDDDDDAQRRPLRALCRALMWHAQQVYHDHSLQQDRLRKAQDERDRAARQRQQSSFALKRKAPQQTSPRILSECIGLGSKWLLERRLRVTLAAVTAWVEEAAQQQPQPQQSSQQPTRRLHTEWLSSSVLAPQAQFTVSLTGTPWYVDASLHGDRLTVTSFVPQYRKVDFHSEHELELFLRQALWSYLSKS